MSINHPSNRKKTVIHYGERIGQNGSLRVGSAAVIFDESRQKVLLTRRADNDQWCLPGAGMEPGESGAENCVREVFEETGLQVRIVRLIGVYSDPNYLVEYPDGNQVQIVAMSFEAAPVGGTLGLSDETTALGYFSLAEVEQMDLLAPHVQRVRDAFENRAAAFFQ